jgi:hypothetical protein
MSGTFAGYVAAGFVGSMLTAYVTSRRWKHIADMDAPGEVYLSRLFLVKTPLLGVYLHIIRRPDYARCAHDHPWPFVTVILAWGTKLSAEVSLVITVIKVTVVLLVVVVGAFYIKTANFSPFVPPAEAGGGGSGAEQSLFSLMTGAEGSTARTELYEFVKPGIVATRFAAVSLV